MSGLCGDITLEPFLPLVLRHNTYRFLQPDAMLWFGLLYLTLCLHALNTQNTQKI